MTANAPLRGRARIVLAAVRRWISFPCLLWDDPMSVAGGGGDTMKEFWRGLSHDLRTIAKMLQHQAAAIIVISETTLHRVLKRSARGAFR